MEKVKNRLSDGRRSPTSASLQSANAATPPATMAAAAAAAAAAACADPWSSLLTSNINFNDPFQMSLLFPLAATNPAILTGFGGLPFGLQIPTMPAVSSAATAGGGQSSSGGHKSSKENNAAGKSSSKSGGESSASSKAQQKAAAAAAEQLAAAAAASMNPFAAFGGGQPSSSGIFGLNPFLAASSGASLMPGFGIPPNFAAMAQLQALMGLQVSGCGDAYTNFQFYKLH